MVHLVTRTFGEPCSAAGPRHSLAHMALPRYLTTQRLLLHQCLLPSECACVSTPSAHQSETLFCSKETRIAIWRHGQNRICDTVETRVVLGQHRIFHIWCVTARSTRLR